MANCNLTQFIDSSEYIGDSLIKINNNFTALKDAVCSLVGASPSVAAIRLSLDPTTAIPTENRTGTNASTLYVHPFKGTSISLYNLQAEKWEINSFETVLSFPLTTLAANTNYDIYLHRNNNLVYNVEFVAWANSTPGAAPLPRVYKDGVIVKSLSEANKRLVGCLRTVAQGQSEQSLGSHIAGGSNTKQLLWNAQNQMPISFYSFETGTYAAVGGSNGWTGWRKVNPSGPGSGSNHRFSFITGDYTTLNIIGQIYSSYYNNLTQVVSYVGFGINNEINPTLSQGFQLISELRGSDMTPRAHILKTFTSGYYYLQLLENILTGNGVSVTMNENHTNQTGYIGTLTI